jgi:hypothetical protein
MIESTLRDDFPDLFRFIERGECGLGYSARFREFHLAIEPGSSAVQGLTFCPFSGKPLPSSLRNVFFDALEAMGLINGLADVDKAPAEFQSELWWLSRGLPA